MDHIEKIEHILFVLNRTPKSADMRLPGCTLYPLKGNINGCYTVTVMANWRIIVRLEDGHAFDIELSCLLLKVEFQGESRTRCTPEELSDKEYVNPLGKCITDAAERNPATQKITWTPGLNQQGIFEEGSSGRNRK